MAKLTEKIRIGIAIGVILLLILFIAFNLESIRIQLLVAKVDMPIAFVVIFSSLAGGAVVWALHFVKKKP